jgi:hypothetical protein
MDTTNIILGAIFLAICIVPFVIMQRSRGKSKNTMMNAIKNIAKDLGLTIGEYEYGSDFIISMDRDNKYVMFCKLNIELTEVKHAKLSEIQSCKVLRSTKSIKTESQNISVTDRVALSVMPASKSLSEISFELYHDVKNMQLNGEIQLAEKWSALINDRISVSV